MKQLVLVRHGESVWNKENRFTGWHDVGLSEVGFQEAKRAADVLRSHYAGSDGGPGKVFTSVLKRAIMTANIILDGLDRSWVPVEKSWRLNERHYGALTGLNKSETAAKHGEAQVQIWRRSYDVPPPPMEPSDARHPANDSRYRDVPPSELPAAEALKQTVDRVLPFWRTTIAPLVHRGESVLVVAHGNSIRALLKELEGISESEIVELNIPTAVPILVRFDDSLRFLSREFLGNADEIKRLMAAVASQGKVRP
jgi:2,3-bisphosphoglycerate-dependent phosphoglycerate mutase